MDIDRENSTIDCLFVILVRRPILSSKSSPSSCPGIGRRIGDYPNIKPLVPIRYNSTTNNGSTSSSSSNNSRSNVLLTQADITMQKDNKFKQLIEQPNVDLSKDEFSSV